jgi:hypothetical protein
MFIRRIYKTVLSISIFILFLPASILPVYASPPVTSSIPFGLGPSIEIFDDSLMNGSSEVAYNLQDQEYMVVWSTIEGPHSTDIWGRRVFMNGSLSTWFNIDASAGVQYDSPVIAFGSKEREYLVTYIDSTNTSNSNIYARTVSWNGSNISSRIDIAINTGIQEFINVVYNSREDEFLIVYDTPSPAGTVEVVGRRYRAADHMLLPPVVIASSPINQYRSEPDVAFNPSLNTYLITYLREDTVAAQYGMASRVISPDLMVIGLEQYINIGKGIYIEPSVACGHDEYLVAWSELGSIYGRLVGGDGNPIGPPNGFLISTDSSGSMIYKQSADVEYLGDSTYIVTWRTFDGLTTDEANIYSQLIKGGSGNFFGSLLNVDTRPNLQNDPSVACSNYNSCLIVYTNNLIDYPGGDTDIFGRIFYLPREFLPVIQK